MTKVLKCINIIHEIKKATSQCSAVLLSVTCPVLISKSGDFLIPCEQNRYYENGRLKFFYRMVEYHINWSTPSYILIGIWRNWSFSNNIQNALNVSSSFFLIIYIVFLTVWDSEIFLLLSFGLSSYMLIPVPGMYTHKPLEINSILLRFWIWIVLVNMALWNMVLEVIFAHLKGRKIILRNWDEASSNV